MHSVLILVPYSQLQISWPPFVLKYLLAKDFLQKEFCFLLISCGRCLFSLFLHCYNHVLHGISTSIFLVFLFFCWNSSCIITPFLFIPERGSHLASCHSSGWVSNSPSTQIPISNNLASQQSYCRSKTIVQITVQWS